MMGNFHKVFTGRTLSNVLPILFFSLYVIFPAGFSTTDGWYYAASIKYPGEVFHPFHLLYNSLGYIFCLIPVSLGADTLASLKVMNALFAVLTIIIVRIILRRMGNSERSVVLISCIAGFSFAVMRYATENETYIVPLALALAATYFFIRFVTSPKVISALYSGLLISGAVLFHFTYIFWWVGLIAGIVLMKKLKPLLLFLLVSLLIPFTYLVVYYILSDNPESVTISTFIFDELHRNAHFSLTGTGLLLSIVSLGRSFLQLHGYMLNMIASNHLFIIPGIISVCFFIYSFFVIPAKRHNKIESNIAVILILVAVLQFLFAVISAGNAEFMVMIPVLLLILIPVWFTECEKFLIRILIGVLIWNIFYGLIPLSIDTSGPEKFLCNKTLQEENVIVIASDDQLLTGMIYYATGNSQPENIFKSPANFALKGYEITKLEFLIDSALKGGTAIFTDLAGDKPISRASILQGKINREFLSKYQTEIVKSWSYLTGEKRVSRITGKLHDGV